MFIELYCHPRIRTSPQKNIRCNPHFFRTLNRIPCFSLWSKIKIKQIVTPEKTIPPSQPFSINSEGYPHFLSVCPSGRPWVHKVYPQANNGGLFRGRLCFYLPPPLNGHSGKRLLAEAFSIFSSTAMLPPSVFVSLLIYSRVSARKNTAAASDAATPQRQNYAP